MKTRMRYQQKERVGYGKMTKELYYDIVIAGCGVAGLYTALSLPRDKRILMLSKEDVGSCDSMLASVCCATTVISTRILRIRCGRGIMKTVPRA